jgi:hypothetical protein
MTEISHVAGKDNVVADALSRYPEMTGQSYDHLLSEEQEMDLLCAHLFNNTSTGGDTTLCVDDFGSTTQLLPHDDSSPVDYSEEVVENLTLPSPSKVGMDGHAASSFVTVELEASVFSEAYPKCSDFQTRYAALQEHVDSDNHQTFPDYTIRKGLLIYFDGLKSRICVPTSLLVRLLEICHDSPLGGHTGARKLKYEMMSQFFWPNIEYLRPYRLRTPDIGPPPASLSAQTVEVGIDGSSWYQVEDILDHRVRAGPLCECLVRWKDFDVSHDSWVQRKFLSPLALQAYDRFLTEHVQVCEDRAKNSKLKSPLQHLGT